MKQSSQQRSANTRAINRLTAEQQSDLDSGNRPAKVRQFKRPITETDTDVELSPHRARVGRSHRDRPSRTHD